MIFEKDAGKNLELLNRLYEIKQGVNVDGCFGICGNVEDNFEGDEWFYYTMNTMFEKFDLDIVFPVEDMYKKEHQTDKTKYELFGDQKDKFDSVNNVIAPYRFKLLDMMIAFLENEVA
ncbi:hypothetical protein POP12_169 [Pectobacterium phage POP12]|nr:hypothetical protein POP12_169 [Pectobacterium phage POP12]